MSNCLTFQVPLTKQIFVHAWAWRDSEYFIQDVKNDLCQIERRKKVKPSSVWISTPANVQKLLFASSIGDNKLTLEKYNQKYNYRHLNSNITIYHVS